MKETHIAFMIREPERKEPGGEHVEGKHLGGELGVEKTEVERT